MYPADFGTINYYQGEQILIDFTIRDAAGALVPLAGFTGEFKIGRQPSETAIINEAPTLSGSVASVSAQSDDLGGIGAYYCELWLNDGTTPVLAAIGYVNILQVLV